jgi:hypothetical protein
MKIENKKLLQIKNVDEALDYIRSLESSFDRQMAYDYLKDASIFLKKNGVSINDTSGEFERFNKTYLKERLSSAAATLGRLGGLANANKTSKLKAATAKENGKKGGRPKKTVNAGL